MAYTYPNAAVGAIILTSLRYQWCGQILRNQFHWRLEQNTNNRSIEQLYDALQVKLSAANELYDKLKVDRAAECVLLDAAHQYIRPARFAGKGYTMNQAGSRTEDNMSITQICAVLTRRAVVATRRGVSALHMPVAVNTLVVDAGVLSAASQTNVGAVGNAILNTASLGDGMSVRPVIYHRGATPEFDYIETFIVQPQVRIVRRRTVGLGE